MRNNTLLQKFMERLKEELCKRYPGADLSFVLLEKEDGREYAGLGVGSKEKQGEYVVLALERFAMDYWSKNLSMDEIVAEIGNVMNDYVTTINVSDLQEFDKIKDRLYMKLVSRERNAEKLQGLVAIPFLDMAILFQIRYSETRFDKIFYTVTEKKRKEWGVTVEELYQAAYKNLVEKDAPQIHEIEELVPFLAPTGESRKLFSGPRLPMYVMTNKDRHQGAVSMLAKDKLREFAGKLGGKNFYLLPSSIHEMILLPEDLGEKEGLVEIVREVNDTEVPLEDILSYHVYKYDQGQDEIVDLCA